MRWAVLSREVNVKSVRVSEMYQGMRLASKIVEFAAEVVHEALIQRQRRGHCR